MAASESVARRLRGDLDTIVLKALQKVPARRYGAVDQLADDISRHLNGRPVLAQPDTIRYRATKFISQHKALVAAKGDNVVGPVRAGDSDCRVGAAVVDDHNNDLAESRDAAREVTQRLGQSSLLVQATNLDRQSHGFSPLFMGSLGRADSKQCRRPTFNVRQMMRGVYGCIAARTERTP